jgi:hypothetical protein
MGRGLFTTNDIKAGDFFLCEKAFEYSYADNAKDLQFGTRPALIYKIIKKLSENPDLIPSFTNIYYGSCIPAVGKEGKLAVDPYALS